MNTVLDTLKLALEQLDNQRQQFDQKVAEERQQYEARRAAIERALSEISPNGTFAKSAEEHAASSNGNGAAPTVLSVGEEKIDAVRQYLRDNGSTRQADIAKALGFNSGTVSVALRVLRKSGEAVPGDKESGSRIWNPARVLAVV